MESAVDDKDREILRLLQADPETTHRELARSLGLSQPAVSARVSKLRKGGLLKVQAGVDVEVAGLSLAKVDVATTDPQALLDGFRNCPMLVNAFLTSGTTNATLLFVGETPEHLQAVVDVHLRPSPLVKALEFQLVTRSFRPWVLPVSVGADRCDRTVCGYSCPECRFYQDDLCTGCPATVFYKGHFWRG